MSILAEVIDRINREMLFLIQPRSQADAAIRTLVAGERLWAVLNSEEGDEEWERRVGELRADLEAFVTQDELGPKYLFLLWPPGDGVWEIRSVRDSPSIRVLGAFALKDCYVAVDLALREELGGWNSQEWKLAKRNTRAVWRQLFPSYNPIISSDPNKVFSGASNGRYIK